jgi:hypothetical protein
MPDVHYKRREPSNYECWQVHVGIGSSTTGSSSSSSSSLLLCLFSCYYEILFRGKLANSEK